MGYRSDVSIVFYTRKPEEAPFSAIKFWFDENYPREEATTEWGAGIDTGHDWVMVTYQNVKWYPDYEHVKAVKAALDSFNECFDANEADGTGTYEMVEVGEETHDIQETRSDYCDYRLNVRREIVLD